MGSVDERVCVSWCVRVLGHEGVGAVKLYVVVSEEAGGNVGGGVEGDGGGVGVECVGDVAGDSIGRDLSQRWRGRRWLRRWRRRQWGCSGRRRGRWRSRGLW